jgi:hypothetical protein
MIAEIMLRAQLIWAIDPGFAIGLVLMVSLLIAMVVMVIASAIQGSHDA